MNHLYVFLFLISFIFFAITLDTIKIIEDIRKKKTIHDYLAILYSSITLGAILSFAKELSIFFSSFFVKIFTPENKYCQILTQFHLLEFISITIPIILFFLSIFLIIFIENLLFERITVFLSLMENNKIIEAEKQINKMFFWEKYLIKKYLTGEFAEKIKLYNKFNSTQFKNEKIVKPNKI